MASSEKRSELVVGIFLLSGLVLLGGLILQFGRFSEYFAGNYTVTLVFDDASGLIKGSEVRMGGARIGRVAKLPELNEAVQVEVVLAIDKNIRIPAGSSYQINSATLLGDKLIVVSPPATMSGLFVAPGSHLRGGGPSGLDALQNNAEMVSRDVLRILKDMEATLGKVDGAVGEMQTASKQLGQAIAKVNGSILAENNLAHINATLANIADASTQWKQTSAQLDPTLSEARDAIASVKSAAASTERTLENADKAIASLQPAIREATLTAGRARNILDRVDRGEGMLGAFATDNDVAFDFKAFMNNLRRHGILRYRNDAVASDGGNKRGETEKKPSPQIKGRPAF